MKRGAISDKHLLSPWKTMVSHLKERWKELTKIETEDEISHLQNSTTLQGRNRNMKNQAILTAVILTSLLAGCDVMKDRETTGQYVDDTGITASISSAIIAEPSLSKFDIHIETLKNEVQLSGFVKTHEQRRLAETIAWDTLRRNTSAHPQYTPKVVNNIKVRP